MNMQKVTAAQAREVMDALLNAPAVLGLELIGSVARHREGNDLDLVIRVDPFVYASYVRRMTTWADYGDLYADFKAERLEVALELLKLPPLVSAWLQCATRGLIIDVHLMPQGWKEHIDEVQSHLPHDDPSFVSKIAIDAVSIQATNSPSGVKRSIW